VAKPDSEEEKRAFSSQMRVLTPLPKRVVLEGAGGRLKSNNTVRGSVQIYGVQKT